MRELWKVIALSVLVSMLVGAIWRHGYITGLADRQGKPPAEWVWED